MKTLEISCVFSLNVRFEKLKDKFFILNSNVSTYQKTLLNSF